MGRGLNIGRSKLIIVTGPTACGKTAYAVDLARCLGTEVLSCDSRQFYREMRIGVARPSDDELAAVKHHFIACRSVTEPYNIFTYEQDAMRLLDGLFLRHDTVVAVGGSGLYIDALLATPARMPDPSPELRAELQQMPLEEKRARLRLLDPDYYDRVDLRNPVRLQRALEVCLTSGRPYSQVVSESKPASRPFETEVRVLQIPNDELRERIDRRVDRMMEKGLLDEVRSLLPYQYLNTLNTVGYRELFPLFEKGSDIETIRHSTRLSEAVGQIKLNTWHYARKQMTWMKKYNNTTIKP